MSKAVHAIWTAAVAGILFLVFALSTSSIVLGDSQTADVNAVDNDSGHDHDHGHEESIQDNLEDIDLSNRRTSEWNRVIATLDHGPQLVSANKPHNFIIEFLDQAGRPVEVSVVTIYADLLTHEDGLTVSPSTIENLGRGRFLAKGFVLSAPGLWQLAVDLEVNNLKDVVVFNLKIP